MEERGAKSGTPHPHVIRVDGEGEDCWSVVTSIVEDNAAPAESRLKVGHVCWGPVNEKKGKSERERENKTRARVRKE